MALTDIRIRQAKPDIKPYKVSDAHGLYLLVQPNGSRLWRYKYRLAGKEGTYAIGAYPDLSLQDARREHSLARERVRAGVAPIQVRRERLAKLKDTFGATAECWYEKHQAGWSEDYRDDVRQGLDRDILPSLSHRAIHELKTRDIYGLVEKVRKRAPTVAIQIRMWISAVFVEGITQGLCDYDPTSVLKRSIKRKKIKHAEPLSVEEVQAYMQKVSAYGGSVVIRTALQLIAYTFVRTIEIRRAEWADFDLDNALWTIPENKMKKRRVHLVPLPTQAVTLLRELHRFTGTSALVFPNAKHRHRMIAPMSINKALERLVSHRTVTGHDFRATASTLLNEAGFRTNAIELQLAHVVASQTERAYNHADYLDERRIIVQWYANKLKGLLVKNPINYDLLLAA